MPWLKLMSSEEAEQEKEGTAKFVTASAVKTGISLVGISFEHLHYRGSYRDFRVESAYFPKCRFVRCKQVISTTIGIIRL